MIKCICVDDKNRPSKVPKSKWVKEGKEYTVIFTLIVFPQKTLAVQLDEIDLDESCMPYSYFLANRFAFNREDIGKLVDFIEECTHINMSIKELLKQTNERATSTSQENKGA
jgi:hypothetical protein